MLTQEKKKRKIQFLSCIDHHHHVYHAFSGSFQLILNEKICYLLLMVNNVIQLIKSTDQIFVYIQHIMISKSLQ